LREGDLLQHGGGAIVLPSFPDPVAVIGMMADDFYDQLEEHGIYSEKFIKSVWSKIDSRFVPPLSALFIKRPSPYFCYDLILAACAQCRHELLLETRVETAVQNVLKKASENGIAEIAFPILLTGGERGKIENIAPVMARQFSKYGNDPNTYLYAHGHHAYEKAKESLREFG
jgi:hypothetical protein